MFVSARGTLSVTLIIMGVDCQVMTVPMAAISPAEYEVIRFIITHIDDSSRYSSVVVTDTTLRTDPVPPEPGTLRHLAPGSYTPRIDEWPSGPFPDSDVQKFQMFFETTNLQSYKLSIDSLHLSTRVRGRDWSRVDQSADSGHFAQGRILLAWFSRVAFDSTGTEALVYTERVCGRLCGEGRWFWLVMSGTSWIIHESVPTWVS